MRAMLQRVLLATFSNTLSFSLGSLLPAVFHFDPFGTEFREPGRVSYPMFQLRHSRFADQRMRNRELQRSFQLTAEFLASARQSGFDCAYAYIERGRDFLVGQTLNVAQNNRLSVNVA